MAEVNYLVAYRHHKHLLSFEFKYLFHQVRHWKLSQLEQIILLQGHQLKDQHHVMGFSSELPSSLENIF